MYLWKSDYMSTKGVILVGNKADLERKREVATSGELFYKFLWRQMKIYMAKGTTININYSGRH